MDNKIYDYFDSIEPSEELIERTVIMAQNNNKKRIVLPKSAIAIAACLAMIVAGVFGANVINARLSAEKTDNPLIVKAYTNASTGTGSHNDKLHYPTDYTDISAGYRDSSANYHGGVDFPCPSDSSVYAAASGTVILAENTKNINEQYGYYIIIDHGNGLSTLYAHNNKLLVDVGDQVSEGQVIALSGSTGNSTGPHCHFEVRVNGDRVDPMNYLE